METVPASVPTARKVPDCVRAGTRIGRSRAQDWRCRAWEWQSCNLASMACTCMIDLVWRTASREQTKSRTSSASFDIPYRPVRMAGLPRGIHFAQRCWTKVPSATPSVCMREVEPKGTTASKTPQIQNMFGWRVIASWQSSHFSSDKRFPDLCLRHQSIEILS